MILLASLVVAGCREGDPTANGAAADDRAAAAQAAEAQPRGQWVAAFDGHDPTLAFRASDPAGSMVLRCTPATASFTVNLPGAMPVASEERLSFGGGGEVVALVATPSGDPGRAGVSASGPLPPRLSALLGAGPSASYAASSIGPLPPVDPSAASAFVAACRAQLPVPPPPARPSACLEQDGKPVTAPAFRLVGTEPFWGGSTEGRCVTYKAPERQDGLRLWTKVAAAGGGWRYSGAIDGQSFALSVTPQSDCSDGMSDRSYAYAAEVRIGGELRRGCAWKP